MGYDTHQPRAQAATKPFPTPLLPSSEPQLRGIVLEIYRGTKEWAVELATDEYAVVGRDHACDVAVPEDVTLSRRHFSLACRSDGPWITDLGSTNGLYLNDTRILSRVRLEDGDVVAAGMTMFTIRYQTEERLSTLARLRACGTST